MHSGQGKGQFMLNVYMVGQKSWNIFISS